MSSKYFVPKKEDLEFKWLEGVFPCQEDDCPYTAQTAKHYTNIDKLAWECADNHVSSVRASDYV